MKTTHGTLRFAHNPWPKGHAIEEVRWAGRLDPKTGVWFDLHLTTEDFDANDKKKKASDADDDEDEDDDWSSKIVWENFGAAALSSLKWEGEHRGFLVGTRKAPLDFAALGKKKSFAVDPAPLPKKLAFGLYAIGHNSAGAHVIRITLARGTFTASIDWSGKLALSFGVSGPKARLDHSFTAKIPKVTFEGFRVADGVSLDDARKALALFVRDPSPFTFVKRKATLWAVPSATRSTKAPRRR